VPTTPALSQRSVVVTSFWIKFCDGAPTVAPNGAHTAPSDFGLNPNPRKEFELFFV